jgi:hypothetical protein
MTDKYPKECEVGEIFGAGKDGVRQSWMRRMHEASQWRYFNWPLILVSAMICIAIGLVSVALGPDNNWDLRFYHLYAPWAYLNHRYLYDIGPAQYQGFFNPTADFLFHALISSPLNEKPRLIAFIMGAAHGINAALILAISVYVLRPSQIGERFTLRAVAFLIGVSGAGFVSLIGTTTNDLVNSILVLAALLGLLRVAGEDEAHGSWSGFTGPGLMAGAGLGLKLTTAIVIPGLALIALIAAVRRRALAGVFVFGAAITIGFLVFAGHHLLTLWQLFGNPVFPLFNDIFQSSYWEIEPLRDEQFLPNNFFQLMAYPFYWAKTNSYLVSELPFRDWRAVIAYIAIVIWTIRLAVLRVMDSAPLKSHSAETKSLGLLTLFVVVSYFVWALSFSIYRYAVTLEMLTGIVIVGVLTSLYQGPRLRIVLSLSILIILAVTTIRLDWGRGVHPSRDRRPATYADKYIDIQVPKLPENSIVLLATGQPASYFIPYAEPSVRYLGIENNYLKLSQDNLLATEVKRLMWSDQPKFIVSVGRFNSGKLNGILKQFDLRLSHSPCEPIRSNLEERHLSICRTSPL